MLYFGEEAVQEAIEEWEDNPDEKRCWHRCLILKTVKSYFPEDEYALVDVSW